MYKFKIGIDLLLCAFIALEVRLELIFIDIDGDYDPTGTYTKCKILPEKLESRKIVA